MLHAQFKSMLSLIDLRIGGDTYNGISVTSRTLYKCSLRRVTAKTTDTDTEFQFVWKKLLIIAQNLHIIIEVIHILTDFHLVTEIVLIHVFSKIC